MSNEKPNLDSLFEAAIAIESAEERESFLNGECGDDHELRQQLERLLASDEQMGSFLDKPAAELEATLLSGSAGENMAASLDAGLASAFGGDAAVVIGDTNHSVLRALGNTLDEVPNVSLRESEAEGADQITRPRSPEIPNQPSKSRYRLDGEIARGGMGAIIKGRDTDLGRDLAIKVLLDSHKDRPEVIQRFIEEAQIAGQLQHPGIAPVYELGQFGDRRPFFSMKLVKGKTLSALLDERHDPSEDRAKLLGIFEQICQTMAYAHSRGVIHRDLKPANIMVGAFGEVQVMDWGLAKVLSAGGIADEKKAHTRHKDISIIQTMRSVGSDTPAFGSAGSETKMGSVMGTPAYMPPEQALGEIDRLDERADVFGLGAILCEILTGKPPYVGEDGTQVFRQASRAKLDDCFARLDGSGVEPALTDLTKRALAAEPEERLRNASVLAEGVTGYLAGVAERLKQAEFAGAEANARAEHATRRRKLVLAIAGLMVVIAAGAGFSAFTFRQQREDQEQLAATNLALAEENDQKRKQAEDAKEGIEVEKQRVEEQRNLAVKLSEDLQRESEKLQYEKYLSDMLLVRQAYTDGTIGRVHELLLRNIPIAGQKDWRRFEWYYWWRVSHLEQRYVNEAGRPFLNLIVSPNHDLLAVHAWRSRLEIRDPDTLELIAHEGEELGIEYSVTMEFSHDSSILATIDARTVRLWSTAKESLQETADLSEHLSIERPHGVSAIAFSPTEALLAIADVGGQITFWNPQTGDEMEGSLEVASSITELAFAPDGARIAALKDKDDEESGGVLVYDLDGGSLVTTLRGRQRVMTSLAWSPAVNRSVLAAGSQSGNVCLWNGDTFEDLDTLRANGMVHSLKFTPDGSRLAAIIGAEQAVQIWETDSSQLVTTIRGHETFVEAAGFADRGETLISSGRDGFLKKWDINRSGAFLRVDDAYDPESTERLRWVFGHEYPVRHSDKAILRGVPAIDSAPAGGHTALSDNKQYLAKLDADGEQTLRLEIWKTTKTDPKLYYQCDGLPRSTEMPVAVAVSDDGNTVAWVRSGEVGIHDAETGKTWFQRLWHDLRCVALTRDGKTMAISDGQRTRTWVFDITNGRIDENKMKQRDKPFPELIHELCYQIPTGIAYDTAFSPDGNHLAIATSDSGITLIDAHSRQELGSFKGHAGIIWRVAFSSDGSLIASGGEDRTVRVWDFQTRQLRTNLSGHDGSVMAVTFSTDSQGRQTITSMDGPGAVFVWSAATKAEVENDSQYWLARSKRYEELGDLENARRDLARSVDVNPTMPDDARFEAYKEAQSWSLASQAGLRLVEAEPEDAMPWLSVAPVIVLSEDQEAYRQFCSRAAKQFAETDSLKFAEKICKFCLLMPDSINLNELPLATISTHHDEGGAPVWLMPWLWTTRSLVAYRDGDAELALAYLQKSAEHGPASTLQPLNLAIRAMAHHQLGRAEQSRSDVQKATELIEGILKVSPDRDVHHDVLIARIMVREAQALIDGAAGP